MIHETEEEKLLFDYAKKYSIDELSVEDIIKLSRTNPISSIVQAFDVSGKEFRDLRKQIGLSNIYLEDAIRNIEVILFYLDSRNKYFSSRIRKKIIDILIYEFGNVSSKREFNLRKLAETDFSREKVREDLENKQIDIEERLKEIEEFVSYIEKLIDYLIEQEKIYLIHCNNKRMYNQLYESKKRGSTFSKDELTYDVLFELSVIENIPDSLIGEIYDLKKNQVRYLRTKVGLSNLHKTKMEIYPETLTYYMEEHNQRPLGASNEDCERIVSQLIENLFGTDNEHDKSSAETVCGNEVTIDVGDEKVTYYVNFSDEKYSVNTKVGNRKANGSRRNQKRENETKRLYGKIGEKIALEAERM